MKLLSKKNNMINKSPLSLMLPVCVRERERERERAKKLVKKNSI
jgi:hypothetical protein